MVKNMLFLDSVHARMGRMILPPPAKKKWFACLCFMLGLKNLLN